ncbi:unnamed protein product [Coffea canephora]|uniref:Uncharacterized protein n=1 Tax=Coffea canephora TaxID=49390 RepID=A0A068ULK7_COFCA|nr:unnamed protein product [Coffea canephora]
MKFGGGSDTRTTLRGRWGEPGHPSQIKFWNQIMKNYTTYKFDTIKWDLSVLADVKIKCKKWLTEAVTFHPWKIIPQIQSRRLSSSEVARLRDSCAHHPFPPPSSRLGQFPRADLLSAVPQG